MIEPNTPLVFDAPYAIRRITLVGCGGTGAQIARNLGRTLYTLREAGLDIPQTITFVDPDHVEAKNVGRQLFAVTDIGRNKAEICARRLNYTLGLNIGWIPEPIKPKHLNHISHLVIGAVDNHLARQIIATDRANSIWLDCGNHHTSGQVVFGNSNKQHYSNLIARPDDTKSITTLPLPSLVFPELLEPPQDDADANLSCADLVLQQAQHLLINDLVATAASQVIYQLLTRQPIDHFITFVSLTPPAMRSVPITLAELQARLN